jgi:hypothetical protein
MKITSQNQHAVNVSIPRNQAFALQRIAEFLSGVAFYGGANPSKWSKNATRALFALKNKLPVGEYDNSRPSASVA